MRLAWIFLSLFVLQGCIAQPDSFEASCDDVSIEVYDVFTGSVNVLDVEVVVPDDSCDYFGSNFYLTGDFQYVVDGESETSISLEHIVSAGDSDCDRVGSGKFSSEPVILKQAFTDADYVLIKAIFYSIAEKKECVIEKSYGQGLIRDSHTVNDVDKDEFFIYCEAVEFSGGKIYSQSWSDWRLRYNYNLIDGVCEYFGVGSNITVTVEGDEDRVDEITVCPIGGFSDQATDLDSGTIELEIDSINYDKTCIKTVFFETPSEIPQPITCTPAFGGSSECFGISPGTEFSGKTCNSTCELTDASLQLDVEFRQCLTETVSQCLSQDPINDLNLEYGTPLLVSFDVPLTPRLELYPPIVEVVVDGQVQASQMSDSGIILFRHMDAGKHNFTITVSHLDYLDVEFSKDIFVKPGLSGEVSAQLYPGEVTLLLGTPLTLNLTLNNSLNVAQNFSLSSNIDADFDSWIYLDANETKSHLIQISPFEQEGSFMFNLSISSADVYFDAMSYITVKQEEIYNATVDLQATDLGARAIITNTGTVWDNYTLYTCNGNTTLNLVPGDSTSFLVGIFDSPCEICLYSDYFFQCSKITPLSLSVSIPSVISAELNNTAQFQFETTATVEGTISVEVDSPWIDDFECSATCNKTIEFTPDKVGDFPVEFHIIFLEADLEGTAKSLIEVIQGFSVSEDVQEIEKEVAQVENKLDLLKTRDVSSPAAEQILLQIKKADPQTPEDVADLLGQVERADKYAEYARNVNLPKPRSFPLTQTVAGFSAILIGFAILYMVFHYKNNPYHPVYRRIGMAPRARYSDTAKRFMKNRFKGSELPKLR